MGWVPGFRRPVRHPDGGAAPPAAGSPRLEVELARRAYVAGQTVTGRLLGATPGMNVALVRLEHRPSGDRAVLVASQRVEDRAGAFELQIPAASLPSADGATCRLSYLVQAQADGLLVRGGVRIAAVARPHLATGVWADRLIPGWDARHFHIELAGAALHGGGRIAGRVHRHGPWRRGTTVVAARCAEAWRSSAPAPRGVPVWHESTLWSAERALDVDSAATWVRFCFDLPDGLPPAIEAATIAWRYELRVRRRAPHRLPETAALTPLLHEDSARRPPPLSR
jgi:hypothetical protein